MIFKVYLQYTCPFFCTRLVQTSPPTGPVTAEHTMAGKMPGSSQPNTSKPLKRTYMCIFSLTFPQVCWIAHQKHLPSSRPVSSVDQIRVNHRFYLLTVQETFLLILNLVLVLFNIVLVKDF